MTSLDYPATQAKAVSGIMSEILLSRDISGIWMEACPRRLDLLEVGAFAAAESFAQVFPRSWSRPPDPPGLCGHHFEDALRRSFLIAVTFRTRFRARLVAEHIFHIQHLGGNQTSSSQRASGQADAEQKQASGGEDTYECHYQCLAKQPPLQGIPDSFQHLARTVPFGRGQ
jgi:hypothetical protein